MRVLICADFVPPESFGGAGGIAWAQAVALAKVGHTVEVFSSCRSGSTRSFKAEGVVVTLVPTNYHDRWRGWLGLYNPPSVRAFRTLLKGFDPDVVHFHNVHQYLSYALLPIARRSGAAVVHTIHDVMPFHQGKFIECIDLEHPVCKKKWDYRVSDWMLIKRFRLRYNPLRRTLIRRALGSAHVLLAVSNVMREALAQNGIVGVDTHLNGIDLSKWHPDPSREKALRGTYGLEGKMLILFAGRLTKYKGGEALAHMFPYIAARCPEAILLAASVPSVEVEKMQQRLGAHMVCTGWLTGDDLRAVFGLCALVVVPSICFESFSLVALEAAASGKPAVVSCFSGPAEVVVEGETGFVAHPLDTQGFAEKIINLLRDPDLRERMGQKAHARAAGRYSFQAHMAALIEWYELALQKGSNKNRD